MTILEAIGLTALPHLGGLIGAFAMKDQIKKWYEVKIERPPWRPPNWASDHNCFTSLTTLTNLLISLFVFFDLSCPI